MFKKHRSTSSNEVGRNHSLYNETLPTKHPPHLNHSVIMTVLRMTFRKENNGRETTFVFLRSLKGVFMCTLVQDLNPINHFPFRMKRLLLLRDLLNTCLLIISSRLSNVFTTLIRPCLASSSTPPALKHTQHRQENHKTKNRQHN